MELKKENANLNVILIKTLITMKKTLVPLEEAFKPFPPGGMFSQYYVKQLKRLTGLVLSWPHTVTTFHKMEPK